MTHTQIFGIYIFAVHFVGVMLAIYGYGENVTAYKKSQKIITAFIIALGVAMLFY